MCRRPTTGKRREGRFFQKDAGGPGVAADVIVADDRNVVGSGLKARRLAVLLVENPVAHRVIGDMVAKGLRNAAETFATHRNDRLAVIFLGLRLGHGLDIVADEAIGHSD